MRQRAGRGLGRSTTARRRSAILNDHAIDAGRISGPQYRAEVLRIFDAVEDNDQRRAGCTAR